MTSGNAFSCRDLTWMKWISTPSISVVNSGSALTLASAFYVMVAAAMASGGLPIRTPAPPEPAQPSTAEPGAIETAEEAST
jgi:hypothetical protein